jgi:hypothetical protein
MLILVNILHDFFFFFLFLSNIEGKRIEEACPYLPFGQQTTELRKKTSHQNTEKGWPTQKIRNKKMVMVNGYWLKPLIS